jgi:hypothetical protein
MGGGLMQLITSGTSDLSLTGNPQITFFHTVYRRYTNYGKRILELSFDNSPNFNTTSYINIPKNNGDLLSKLILKIKLPRINFKYLNDLYNTYQSKINISDDITYYEYYKTFLNSLKNIIRLFFNKYDNVVNYISYIQDLKKYILKYINVGQYNEFFNIINYFFNNRTFENIKNYNIELYTNSSLFKIINDELIYIYEKFTNENVSYQGFKFTIQKNIDILDILDGEIYNKIKFENDNNINLNNIKVCWVNKIAIYLFNSIDFYIGSNKIYSLSDTYINNYSELYYKNIKLYDKLIGNNSQINEFNTIINEELLYLPIPFWNLSNYGLAFPLISLQYNSLQIKINTKKLFECIRINTGTNNNINKNEILNLLTENLDKIFVTELEITLLNELIYLDSIERNKFARSSHEYLIEQVQQIEFNKISPNNNTIQLDIFHCCKDMFWFVQKVFTPLDIFSKNINAFNYIYPNEILENNLDTESLSIYNYSLMLYSSKYLFNPFTFNQGLYVLNNNLKYLELFILFIEYSSNRFIFKSSFIPLNKIILESYFYLNGTQLFGETSNYFNYLQPYSYYNSTPQIGLSTYSFCLSPIEFQPTGSCNMSRISYIGLKLKINEKSEDNFINKFINKIPIYSKDEYKLIFQTRNFNVLRIIGGIGATAYTYN